MKGVPHNILVCAPLAHAVPIAGSVERTCAECGAAIQVTVAGQASSALCPRWWAAPGAAEETLAHFARGPVARA